MMAGLRQFISDNIAIIGLPLDPNDVDFVAVTPHPRRRDSGRGLVLLPLHAQPASLLVSLLEPVSHNQRDNRLEAITDPIG